MEHNELSEEIRDWPDDDESLLELERGWEEFSPTQFLELERCI